MTDSAHVRRHVPRDCCLLVSLQTPLSLHQFEDSVMAYEAASERYSQMAYRTCGKSGLKLPALSLARWHNFGDTTPISTQRDTLRPPYHLLITHCRRANH